MRRVANEPDPLARLDSGALVRAGQRVLGRLLDALTYEEVLRPEVHWEGDHVTFSVSGAAAGAPVRYVWRARRRHSFGRLRTLPGTVQRHHGSQSEAAFSPERFLREVGEGLHADSERLAGFGEELARTVLNEAVVIDRSSCHSFDGSYDAFETAASGGHPSHPSYKSRIGFDPADNVAFGPEWGPRFQPRWLAVRRQVLEVSALPGLDVDAFLTAELGAEAHHRLVAHLSAAGVNPSDYLPVPVHPWQWRERLLPRLVAELADTTVIAMGADGDEYQPQQSIRTLANATVAQKASLKLALSIVNTSTVRTIAAHTVANAPAVTAWLRRVVDADPYLVEELRLVLLGEVLGISFCSGGLLDSGELSVIWRESVHAHLDQGEGAVPFTALAQLDPDGRPFIASWVEDQGVERFTQRLLQVAVPPVVHLLSAHGVGLEAHAQNMVLLHRGGVPARIALRDFSDGVRFVPTLLADPGSRPVLRPVPVSHLRVNRNSYLEAENPADVRDFTHDALFFVNLAELAMFLDDHYGLAERRFWNLARAVVLYHRRRFPALVDRFALFDVLAPRVGIEQLATRRLLADTEVRIQLADNPLAHQADGP